MREWCSFTVVIIGRLRVGSVIESNIEGSKPRDLRTVMLRSPGGGQQQPQLNNYN